MDTFSVNGEWVCGENPDPTEQVKVLNAYMEWSTKKETITTAQEKWRQAWQAMTNWVDAWREAGKQIQQELKFSLV